MVNRMHKTRAALALLAVTGSLAACATESVSTTEALLATTPPSTTTALEPPITETPAAGQEFVAGGCRVFAAAELGRLTPIGRPLQLVEEASDAASLTCNFVRAGDGLDTGVRIEIVLLSSLPDGHFTTAGQLESPVTIGDTPGVGTGRGALRLALDDTRGLTLAVTIRSISSTGVIPRDGEYLDIRDTVAAYLVDALN